MHACLAQYKRFGIHIKLPFAKNIYLVPGTWYPVCTHSVPVAATRNSDHEVILDVIVFAWGVDRSRKFASDEQNKNLTDRFPSLLTLLHYTTLTIPGTHHAVSFAVVCRSIQRWLQQEASQMSFAGGIGGM